MLFHVRIAFAVAAVVGYAVKGFVQTERFGVSRKQCPALHRVKCALYKDAVFGAGIGCCFLKAQLSAGKDLPDLDPSVSPVDAGNLFLCVIELLNIQGLGNHTRKRRVVVCSSPVKQGVLLC